MKKLIKASVVLSLLGSVTSPAWGQDVKRYAPPITGGGTPAVIKGPEIPPGMSDAKPLVKSLRGVVIVGKPALVSKSGTTANGLEVRDQTVTLPPGAAAAIRAHLGKAISLKSLGDMTREVVLAYRDADLPVVNVAAPEQDLSNGVLQLIVVVGRLGDLRVEGNRYFPAEAYIGKASVQPGQIINGAQMLEDLRYMNRSPFRRVDAVYAPGRAFGLTDVALRPVEYRPFSAFAGYNNDGNKALGYDRLNFGFLLGNTFGLDEVVGYQVTTTKNFDNLFAHVLSAQIPLPSRAELQLVGSYVTSTTKLGDDVRSDGDSRQLSAYYLKQLPRIFGWSHDVKVGAEFKRSNNNLEFGGTTVTDTEAEIYQLTAGWSGETVGRYGHTRAHVNSYYSPGGLTGSNSDSAFNALRAGADASYAYARFGLDHRVDLPGDWRFLTSMSGQVANSNLLASESFTLGGQGSVRGFETNLVRGDNGFATNMTLYTPGIAIFGPFQRRDWLGQTFQRHGKGGNVAETVHDQVRAFTFLDYGWTSSHSKLADETSRSLAGAGIGLSYEMGRHFSAELSYGWQIVEKGFKDQDTGFWHLRSTKRF